MEQKTTQRRLIRTVRRTKLQSRLLVTCLLMSLVPVLIVGLYAYNVYTNSINRHLGQSAEQTVKLLDTAMVSELEKYTTPISAISVTDTVQDILSTPAEERSVGDGSVTQAIKQQVLDNPAQSPYMRTILVFDKDRNVLYDRGFDYVTPERMGEIIDGIDAASPRDSLQYLPSNRPTDTLILGRKIYRFARSNEPIGYILFYIDEGLISNHVFSDISFGPDSNILLIDSNGTVLSSKDRALMGQSLNGTDGLYGKITEAAARGETTFNTRINGMQHLVVFSHNSSFNSYFVATIPQTYITGETRHITAGLALVAVGTILVGLIVTVVVYLSIVQPIRRIMAFCSDAAKGSRDGKLEDDSPDELGILARAVDTFVQENQELADKSKRDERKKRDLELERLQYQINPHFLFNTLNTLKWVAVINEVPVLEEGISSLSQLLQSTLMQKDETISIGEEIENLKHYFAIQKIRYADCFTVEYRVDESLLAHKVPRFILQPLAENAILHGMREGGQCIHIIIDCHRMPNGDISLTVEDDGLGFEAAAVREMQKERFSGIGLSNVHERIRLHFGKPYGLQIESRLNTGTVCRIVLPGTEQVREGGGEDV